MTSQTFYSLDMLRTPFRKTPLPSRSLVNFTKSVLPLEFPQLDLCRSCCNVPFLAEFITDAHISYVVVAQFCSVCPSRRCFVQSAKLSSFVKSRSREIPQFTHVHIQDSVHGSRRASQFKRSGVHDPHLNLPFPLFQPLHGFRSAPISDNR